MADYWVCSECGLECEVVDITLDDTGDMRSDCCGALPEYRTDEGDWKPTQDWDWDRYIDY
jgi:hypothetical protein